MKKYHIFQFQIVQNRMNKMSWDECIILIEIQGCHRQVKQEMHFFSFDNFGTFFGYAGRTHLAFSKLSIVNFIWNFWIFFENLLL
jgi:hypothetical protein